MQLVVPPEVRRVELGGGGVAQREEVVRLAGRQAQRVDHGVGTPNDRPPGLSVGERVLERQRRLGLVLAEGVDDVERVGRGLDPRQVELRDLADRLEDGGELLRETRHLFLGQAELRELRDVQHLLSRDGHPIHPLKAEAPEASGRRALRGPR